MKHYFRAEMPQPKILVVDDNAKIRALLRSVFEGGGYDVIEAEDVASVHACLGAEPPDLITLDLQLGREDGLDVARAIRKVSQVPIIMVTGRDDVVDRVVGLELGADDYITKPFHVREVLARARSVLRRAAPSAPADPAGDAPPGGETEGSAAFAFDGLTVVPDRFELYDRDGALCELTSGDFRLLNVFLENAKRVLSRDALMDLTGGAEWSPLDRTIDNQVARLRKKLERDPANPRLIKTVRGVGYSFASEVRRVQPEAPASSA